MQDDEERLSKTFWEVELRKLNDGLPRLKKPLAVLLREERPSYKNLSNEEVSFDKKELMEIARLVPQEKMDQISLPFVIIKESGSKKGVYVIQGNESERSILNSVLKKPKDNRFIYLPEILELSKKYPSLIVFGFQF
ncbi:MAG: DUF61 family protein [Candidatus Methanomethyliaceae archaeon]|nr:DUF61 family protein [Candidatus Methanomethyliaceae archaeon]